MIISTQNKDLYIFLACLLFLGSCQKDGDVLERKLNAWRPSQLITILSDNPHKSSRDTIFWFQDPMGRVDSAYRYDSVNRRRYKAFNVDRSRPGMIIIDDGETWGQSAYIHTDMMGYPHKVEFFDRMSSTRKSNTYLFVYNSNKALEYYVDSIYSSMTMEIYGDMSGNMSFPKDSFEKVGIKGGNFMTEHYISATKRQTNISPYRFVPFISTMVVSNIAYKNPSPICRDLFEAYIWGEVMRPWLPKELIASFDYEQVYPVKNKKTYSYTIQASPNQIIYSDGIKTISNYYP